MAAMRLREYRIGAELVYVRRYRQRNGKVNDAGWTGTPRMVRRLTRTQNMDE